MSSNNIASPHDKYFRHMMSDLEVARNFFKQYLPAKVQKKIDFDKIEPQKDSFVSDSLKQQIADLLFLTEFDGETGYIYILIEHQSTPDKLMPFRISKYMNSIFDQHLKKTKSKKLPIIYPIIFYSGGKKYQYSTDLFDLFEENKNLAMDIMLQPFQLIDLSEMSDEELKQNILYGFFIRVMKYAHEKNKEKIMVYLEGIIKDLVVIKNVSGKDCFCGTLTYIVEIYDVSIEEVRDMVKENLSSIEEEKIMTLAERLRKEGMEQGMEQGIKMVSVNLLCQGMDVQQVSFVTGLSIEEVKLLKNSLQN